ncbi:MAG TPA: hypothetical protein VH439_17350 [Gemmatimonadales bacterium]|jgi:hypothetical protein
MAKGITRLAGTWSYVLTADRELPVEEQSRFTLRPLTGAERERFIDDMSVAETVDGAVRVHPRTRQIARRIAISHIAAIENFPAGAPKPWPADAKARDDYLELLDDGYVFELGNEIYLRSSLGATNGAKGTEDAKPVGESSTPAPTSSLPVA